jgi:hypothetical protein
MITSKIISGYGYNHRCCLTFLHLQLQLCLCSHSHSHFVLAEVSVKISASINVFVTGGLALVNESNCLNIYCNMPSTIAHKLKKSQTKTLNQPRQPSIRLPILLNKGRAVAAVIKIKIHFIILL